MGRSGPLSTGRLQQTSGVSVIGRTRAERLLDGLYTKQSQGIQRALRDKRRAQYKLLKKKEELKRIKLDSAVPGPAKQRSVAEALQVMGSHARNPSKLGKVVVLLLKLLESGNLTAADLPTFVETVYSIVTSSGWPHVASARNDLRRLFSQYILPMLCSSTESSAPASVPQEQIGSSDSLKVEGLPRAVLEVAVIPGLYHAGLFTDDTYEFNSVLSKLREVFNCMRNDRAEGQQHSESADPSVSVTTVNHTISTPHESRAAVSPPSIESGSTIEPCDLTVIQRDGIENSHLVECGGTESRPDLSSSTEPTNHQKGDQSKNSDQCSGPSEPCDAVASVDDAPRPPELPSIESLILARERFFIATLATVAQRAQEPWAKVAVEEFLTYVYRNRSIFSESDQRLIERFLVSVRTRKPMEGIVTQTLGIGESANKVIDARDQRISSLHGSHVWSAKQTGL